MDDLEWPRVVNRVITQRWSQLKNTLVMKDFVDYLIQKRVVTLDYWMGLKTKPITESERTEDFLFLVMKFDQQKYQHFLEALLTVHRDDLVRELLNAQNGRSKRKGKQADNRGDNIPPLSRSKNAQGQTDADQQLLPTKPVLVKPTPPPNLKDGHNGSQEAFGNVGKPAKSDKLQPKQPEATNQTDKQEKNSGNSKPGSFNKMSKTDKLHHGIGTAVKAEVKAITKGQANDCPKPTKADHEQQNNDLVKESSAIKSEKTTENSTKDSDSVQTLRPDTAKSKEELLEIREWQLNSREWELDKKQNQLNEQEEKLKIKETELITRENSLLTMRSTTAESLTSPTKLLKDIQMNIVSTSSTTESSDVLADVREQLAAMKRVKEEIESEHTTYCNTPKDDYVKLQDFMIAQQEIEELKEEVITDRSNRKAVEQRVESLQCKVEDLRQEISELQTNFDKLQTEKEQTSLQLTKELNKLKSDMKNNQKVHEEKISKLETEMQAKDSKCTELNSNIEDVVKAATELEERVEILENEKNRQEQELQEYQKDISFLKKELQAKEAEINDLKKVLEETENEKDELIEILAGLKKHVSTLQAEKRQLEQDKRTLLGRCAKPQWNVTTRRTTFK